MIHCLKCASAIEENEQYYIIEEMGPEIVAILENPSQMLDINGAICSQCFANITEELANAVQQNEQHCTHTSANTAGVVCVCCQRALGTGRCHSVGDGPERHFISARISPRQIPDGAVVCHCCWLEVQQTLYNQGVEYVPSPNTVVCVWCLQTLTNRRRHSLPDGPERNEIIARIQPREIPSGGLVCYACWVAARRNMRRAADIENVGPSHEHYGVNCVWCRTSLFQRQVCILNEGPERDVVADRQANTCEFTNNSGWKALENYC